MECIEIYTIGFTQKTAEIFFEKLKQARVERMVDVRLNNSSQLAGFAKKRDLTYFLKKLAGMDYIHFPDMAPTEDILKEYKKNKGSWSDYEKKFMKLMEQRQIEKKDIKKILHQSCLLCSEHEPDHCHRRLIIEYLKQKWPDTKIQVKHL